MLDLKFIHENTELVREAIANRQDSAPVEEILELDGQRRQKIQELERISNWKGVLLLQISPTSTRVEITYVYSEIRH